MFKTILSPKYSVKIPRNIKVIYFWKKNILAIIGSWRIKLLRLKFKVKIIRYLRKIYISGAPGVRLSYNQIKKRNSYRGTIIASIWHLFMETSEIIFVKLRLVGVGYKAFSWDEFSENTLLFKLGYCHPLYFKTIGNLKVGCLKHIRLFVFGQSYQLVFQTAAVLQDCRYPDPYKGKGVLLEEQKIQLKQGKKI